MSRISDEELISELKRLSKELGETPTKDAMNKTGKFSPSTYRSHFGSWNEALREAGLPINNERNCGSNEELISELKRLANELGETPAQLEMEENGKFSYNQYIRRFGSWNEALREAGLPINKERNCGSNEELISELKRLANELGETPVRREMEENGKFGSGIYENRFGCWNDALRESGIEVNQRKQIPDEELISELQRVESNLGKTPSYNEMREHGKFGRDTYQNRFGSWNQALREAGFDPIQEYPIEPEWADDISDYYGQSWPEMRTLALDRDEHTCQACGATEAIHVHHITPRRCFENPDDSNTIENLISLCSRCHGRFEGQWMDCTYSEFKSKAQQSIDQ